MKVIKNCAGDYYFKFNGEHYSLLHCDVTKSWAIYGFGNQMFAGGCTKKEALENFTNKTNRTTKTDNNYSLKIKKTQFRCSGCNMPTYKTSGKFVRWDNRANDTYKICDKCIELSEMNKIKTVSELNNLLHKVGA